MTFVCEKTTIFCGFFHICAHNLANFGLNPTKKAHSISKYLKNHAVTSEVSLKSPVPKNFYRKKEKNFTKIHRIKVTSSTYQFFCIFVYLEPCRDRKEMYHFWREHLRIFCRTVLLLFEYFTIYVLFYEIVWKVLNMRG